MAAQSDALPYKVQVVVDEVLKEQGFENAEVSVNLFSAKGENYLGIIYGVQAAIFGKKIELIVKVAPALEGMRGEFQIGKYYEREFFVYEKLLAEFDKLQINAGIPKEDRLHSPKYYKICNDYLSETLVLEDLKASGYKIFNRFNRYDFEHARLTLEAIGKYHAHSFVLQRDDPEKYAYFVENMQESMFVADVTPEYKANYNKFLFSSISKAIENLDSDELKEKLREFGENIFDKLVESLKPKGISVLGHGDCWSNNMMYKYADGKPVDIRLLDYQIGRYSSPVLDIMYFIFCCTDQDLRKTHYDDMLKAYHNALRDHLARFSMEVEKCYPWATLLEDLKTFATYPLGIAVNNVLLFSLEEKSVASIDEFTPDKNWIELPMFKKKPSEQYRYKINGLVADFHRLGYF